MLADKIPCLGEGGKKIADYLVQAGKELKPEHDAIEIGSWLGSATAYVATGMNGNKQSTIHCFDKWCIDRLLQQKAKKAHGLTFQLGQNIEPVFAENMAPFGVKITTYRGLFTDFNYYPGRPIGLVVDDICSGKILTDHLFKTFSPYFIAGVTKIFMMDFYFYETKDLSCRLYQRDFVAKNKECFKSLGRLPGSRTAVFIWMGGKLEYLPEGPYNQYFKEIE